jgi:hypothetical protein
MTMGDSYLAISQIAKDEYMQDRVKAAVTQQWHLGNIDLGISGNNAYNVSLWVEANCYLWASSPSWGEKWAYALAANNQEPGKDEAVITDADILATVQALFSSE